MLHLIGFIKKVRSFVTTFFIMQPNILNTTVGNNVRLLRDKMGLTQQVLADYLQVPREQISYYEQGKRSIPTAQISALANLFCVDESDLYEEDTFNTCINVAFAFRADELIADDLKQIAVFKRIVRNYTNMQKALINE